MISTLSQIIRDSKKIKTILRYFSKVWRKSNLCILRFDWLTALYIFNPLPCNASFLIVKKSCVRDELSDVKKSLFKNIFLESLHWRTSPLVLTPPQLTLPPSPTTPSTTPACVLYTIYNAWDLAIFSHPTSSQESLK